MNITETLTEALTTLLVNKLRTVLATLGIVIGIASVIALISLGEASQQAVENQIQSLGSNLLTVTPGAPQSGNVRGAIGGATTLTYDDAKAITSSPDITAVAAVSPEYTSRSQVTVGRNNTNTQIIGSTPAYATVRKLAISTGTFLTNSDITAQSRVAVLGPQVVVDLFGEGSDPLGQTIRINGVSLKVVGTTVSKGGSGFLNQDDRVYVPLTTAQKQLFGSSSVTSIAVEAKSADSMTAAQDQIGYLLLIRHKMSDPANADFTIQSQNDILSTASSITGTFTALLSGIAAISLVVGGIGIMNIMLVTVTERTREIGLRKALGAKKRAIISQFLIETIILTFVGGVLGMLLGILASYIISSLISLPFTLSPVAILLAIGVSGAIGILFGYYPARKAANLEPIEALRYE